MELTEPNHLIGDPSKFLEIPVCAEEVVFRRFSNTIDPAQIFAAISRKYILEGLSVNSEKYSHVCDVFWSINTNEGECSFVKKAGIAYKLVIGVLGNKEFNNTELTFSCIRTPFKCNISHCDIRIVEPVEEKDKALILRIKAFLNICFTQTGHIMEDD